MNPSTHTRAVLTSHSATTRDSREGGCSLRHHLEDFLREGHRSNAARSMTGSGLANRPVSDDTEPKANDRRDHREKRACMGGLTGFRHAAVVTPGETGYFTACEHDWIKQPDGTLLCCKCGSESSGQRFHCMEVKCMIPRQGKPAISYSPARSGDMSATLSTRQRVDSQQQRGKQTRSHDHVG